VLILLPRLERKSLPQWDDSEHTKDGSAQIHQIQIWLWEADHHPTSSRILRDWWVFSQDLETIFTAIFMVVKGVVGAL